MKNISNDAFEFSVSANAPSWVTLASKPWWLSKIDGKDFGTHGYDNIDKDMFGFFLGHGPDFITGHGSADAGLVHT